MSVALEKASAVGYSEPDVLSAEGGKMFAQNLGQDSCQKLPRNPYLVNFLGSGDLCFNSSNCGFFPGALCCVIAVMVLVNLERRQSNFQSFC